MRTTWGLLTVVLVAGTASAHPILTKSKAAQTLGLTFLIAQAKGNEVRILPSSERLDGQPAFLLNGDGTLRPLKGKLSGTNGQLAWGCGEDEEAAVLRGPKGVSLEGALVVVGKNARKVKWTPAKKLEAPWPACVTWKAGYEVKVFEQYAANGTAGPLYFAAFESLKLVDAKDCPASRAEVVGFLDAKGACVTLNTLELDCDALPVPGQNAHSMQHFVGRLVVGDETWLVFRAQGYESGGYTVRRYQPGKKPGADDVEEVHAWGC